MSDKFGNSGALGLCAFGISTLCMMLMDTKMIINGADAGMAVILSLGILYGGLVQFIVGFLLWKTGDTFGTVSFTSYGVFWMSFCLINGKIFGIVIDPKAMGIYMLAWTLFTVALFVATLRLEPLLKVIFGITTVVFTLLTIVNFTGPDTAVAHITPFVGVVLGLVVLYGGVAQVINEVYGEEILPIGSE